MGVVATLRPVKTALGRVMREAVLYPQLLRGRGQSGLRVAFLPWGPREQSSLLRAHKVAEGLAAQHGCVTLVVPSQLRQSQRKRVLRTFGPDVVVVQKCRHPLNRMPHLAGWPLVLDIDDADFLDPALTGVMAEVARGSLGVICGSRYIRDWAEAIGTRAEIVWTGTPVSPGPWPDHVERAPIIAWAQSSVRAYPREYDHVCEVVKAVAARRGGARLRIYGWDLPTDHPTLADLRKAGVEVELRTFMPYAAFLASLREVAVGLAPIWPEGFGLGKSFGKVLGYLDAKVPVVCSEAADHALFFNKGSGVVSNTLDVWVSHICALLEDPSVRTAMSEAAHADFTARLSTAASVHRVNAFLTSVLAEARQQGAAGITKLQMTG